MKAAELMKTLEGRGVRLSVRKGNLHCVAPPGAVTAEIKEAMSANKAALIAALTYQHNLAPPQIRRADRNAVLPLSFAQLRLWFLHQLEPGDASYNIPAALRLLGDLNVAAFIAAINEIVRRHEVLRTTIATTPDGEARQNIAPALAIEAPVVDLSGLAPAEREAEARRRVDEEAQHPFDLEKGPLLRVLLLDLGHAETSEREHVAVVTMHHIVSDGWSTDVFIREFATLYEAFAAGRSSPLEKLPIQYADYALWQRAWLQGEVLERQLAYWRAQLAGAPPVLELPTDRPRPAVQDHAGATHNFTVSKEVADALRRLSRREGATLFMTLLAAFELLLSRYSGQTDICVGTPIANRRRVELEGLIGFFVNTLVLRSDLSGNPSFSALLARVRETALEAQAHQDLPFERLVEELQPQRDMSVTPLFQASFDFQNAPATRPSLSAPRVQMLDMEARSAKFDLSLTMEEHGGGLRGSIEYATALFDAKTAERLAQHFCVLLEGVVANPQSRIGELPMLSEGERQLLSGWNATAAPFAEDACLHELFEAQAAKRPHAIAATFEEAQLTYGELNARANRLAHALRRRGVGPDVLVGLCVERSLEMVIGLLGVLKAGGAYLPLDPSYPQERLAYMIDDAAPVLVLTQESLRARLPQTIATLGLDADWEQIQGESAEDPSPRAQPQNLAYVIYTSGSTGQPKGVGVVHCAVVNLVQAQSRAFKLTSRDRVLQLGSLAFDLAVEEIFCTLEGDATLVLCPEKARASWTDFLNFLIDNGVTILDLPTAFWSQFTAWIGDSGLAPPQRLRLVCVGGEKASAESVRLWRAHAPSDVDWINSYGPTETTITATVFEADRSHDEIYHSIPIGRPIQNVHAYLCDADMNLAPIGATGELYIGGTSLARGYLKRPDLTAERFVPNPFGGAGERLYRTGDLARYRADGNIAFLGRVDHQVKIRGFRIELGEIEATLARLPQIREAVVLGRDRECGETQLVAYVTGSSGAQPDIASLRASLSRELPDYMVPSAFVVLESFPLTPNGKIDRNALPSGDLEMQGAPQYAAPRSVTEWILANEFRTVLGVERIGVHDNFFHLGGNSLSGLKLADRIRRTVYSALPVSAIFQAQTIAKLANWITRNENPAQSPLVLMRSGGGSPPLFLIHPAGGSIIRYRPLANALSPERAVYGLQSRTLIEPAYQAASIREMAQDYVDLLRKQCPQVSYCLLGWSMGGAIAISMAERLEALREKVAFVGLLDSTLASPDTEETAAEIGENDRAQTILNYIRSFARLQRVIENKGHDVDVDAVLTPLAREYLSKMAKRLSEKECFVYAALWGQEQGIWDNVSEELMNALYSEEENSERMMRDLELRPIKAPIHVWWTQTTLDMNGGAPVDWAAYTKTFVKTEVVTGDHENVIADPFVHKRIDAALNALSAERG